MSNNTITIPAEHGVGLRERKRPGGSA
jgi:hypothetical protein